MRRVLLITNSENNLSTHRSTFIKTCHKLGYELTILTPERSNFLRVRGYRRNFFTVVTIYDLIDLIFRNKIDLIVSFTMAGNLLAILVGIFRLETKIISNITGLGSIYISKSFFSLIISNVINLSLRYSNCIIVQNSSDLHFFRAKKFKNLVLINGSGYKPLETVVNRTKSNDNLKLAFVGRLIKEKGIRELIEAVENYFAEYSHSIELHIYGDIDESNPSSITAKDLAELIKKPFIRYHGYVKDFSFSSVEVDFTVLPSYREGASMTIIESLAHGIPVITSNRPGCGELLILSKDLKAGFTFNLDEEGSLYKILVSAAKVSDCEWYKMSNNSVGLFRKKYSSEVIEKSYADVLKEVV